MAEKPPTEIQDAMKALEERFGNRLGMLFFNLMPLSGSGQPCDVTFCNRKPILNVRVNERLFLAMTYGAGSKRLAEMLNAVKFSDGTTAGIEEIWTINPMPRDGFTDNELAAVDMTQAAEAVGPNGETLRHMIRQTYHCDTVEKENEYLRRFIGS